MPNNNNNKGKVNKNVQKSTKKTKNAVGNRMVTSSAPLAINVRTKGVAPVVSSGAAGTVVSHTEVISSAVPALATFGLTHTIAVQPGLTTYSRGSPLGNWLPQIANQYDHYEFLRLKIRYVPTCATTRDGLVMMSFEPNPEDNPPSDFVTFKNATRNVSAPVREPLVMDVSDLVRKKLLVRSANVGSLPLYDIGKIFVASMNGNDLSAGYLEVDYSVRFSCPQSNLGTIPILSSTSVFPTWKSRISTDQGPFYCGRASGARNYSKIAGNFFADTATKEGDLSIVTSELIPTTGATDYVLRGSRFSCASGLPIFAFRFNYPGTYRVSWFLVGDLQDYVPFRANLLKLTVPTVGVAPIPSDVSLVVPSIAGVGLTISGDDSAMRGFSVPSISWVDAPLTGSTLLTVTSVTDRYTLAVGIWANALIAEADDGTINVAPGFTGSPMLKIEYISTATTY